MNKTVKIIVRIVIYVIAALTKSKYHGKHKF